MILERITALTDPNPNSDRSPARPQPAADPRPPAPTPGPRPRADTYQPRPLPPPTLPSPHIIGLPVSSLRRRGPTAAVAAPLLRLTVDQSRRPVLACRRTWRHRDRLHLSAAALAGPLAPGSPANCPGGRPAAAPTPPVNGPPAPPAHRSPVPAAELCVRVCTYMSDTLYEVTAGVGAWTACGVVCDLRWFVCSPVGSAREGGI